MPSVDLVVIWLVYWLVGWLVGWLFFCGMLTFTYLFNATVTLFETPLFIPLFNL